MSDGRIKYVHEECTTDFDLDGKPIISRGTVQDISELIIAQEKLINSEKLLSDIIENLPIRVFWKDRDGRYLGCNSIFARDAGKKSPMKLLESTISIWLGQLTLNYIEQTIFK